MTNDEAARTARAKRLRAEIAEKLNPASPPASPTGGGAAAPADTAGQPPARAEHPQESPREFVHRRMHELEEESKRPPS